VPDHHLAVLERPQRAGNEVDAAAPLDEVGLVGPAEGGAVEGGDCRVVPGAFLGDGDHRPSIEALRIGGHDPGRAGPPAEPRGPAPRSSAGPPLDEPEADQGGGEAVEALEDVGPALVADGQPPEAGEPGQRALYHPAVAAQAFRALDPAPGDPGDDAPPAAGAAAAVVVVPFVGVQLARASARPAGALPDGLDRVEQGLEEPAVVHVRGAEQERERDAAGVDDDVPLGPGLAAVGRVRAGQLAPLLAGKDALSSEQRPKSIALARPSRSSSSRWSRSKTPAACQSRSLRQQVMPQP
jgi:hypothetical protein